MAFEDEAKLVRDHVDLIHRLNLAMVEAFFRVAEETDTPPLDLARMVGFGGSGLHTLFQPLMLRLQEEDRRRALEAHRAAQEAAKTGDG